MTLAPGSMAEFGHLKKCSGEKPLVLTLLGASPGGFCPCHCGIPMRIVPFYLSLKIRDIGYRYTVES
jgi:hypothetical protein